MYNTINDAVDLIRKSKRIMILTGAGISAFIPLCYVLLFVLIPHDVPGVSCGIPDFRSRDGLYATLQRNGEYSLDDPQQM